MRNKNTKILTELVIVLLLSPTIFAATLDIAYVVKNFPENKMINILDSSGYSYEIITESQIRNTNFSNYRLILVGEGLFNNANAIPVNSHNSIILNSRHYYKTSSTNFQWGWSESSTIISRSFLLMNNVQGLPVTENLSENYIAYTASGINAYALSGRRPNGLVLASYSGSGLSRDFIVAYVNPGTMMLNGQITQGRSVFFGLINSEYWTNGTEKLFKNALKWAINYPERDIPVLIENINDITINEEETTMIDIKNNFISPANRTLNFSIEHNDLIESQNLGDGKFLIAPKKDFYGVVSVVFKASDGITEISSNNVSIIILNVNDPPILKQIEDIYLIIGSKITIYPEAYDADGDNITFEFESPFNSAGEWIVDNDDEGEHIIGYSAIDSYGERDRKEVKIIVIPRLLINEFYIGNNENDSWIEIYNSGNSKASLSNCKINSSREEKILNGEIESREFYWINLGIKENDKIRLVCNGLISDEVSIGENDGAPIPYENQSSGRIRDGLNSWNNSRDFRIFEIPTRGISNEIDMIAPVVELISPENDSLFNVNSVVLNFTAIEDSNSIRCELYSNINGQFRLIESINPPKSGSYFNGSFVLNGIGDGTYIWNIRCSDSINSAFADENKTFIINVPNSPIFEPISIMQINENETLVFSVNASDPDGDEISYRAEGLPIGATFINKTFTWTPIINQSGIYNVIFIAKDSTGLESRITANIIVNKIKIIPEFSGINKCQRTNSDITLSIRSPNNRTKIEIGSKLEVILRIKNNINEVRKLEIESYLYDLTNNIVIEKNITKTEISEKSTEDKIVMLEVPSNIEENKEYAVFVKVISKNSSRETCNYEYTEIKIERPSEKVIIENFEINPISSKGGNDVLFSVKLSNIGKKQSSGYFEIINNDLNLSIKNEFEIGEYNNKSRIIRNFVFNVPLVSPGTYEIKLFLKNGNSEISETKKMVISERITSNEPNINQKLVMNTGDKEENLIQTRELIQTYEENREENVRTYSIAKLSTEDNSLRTITYSLEENRKEIYQTGQAPQSTYYELKEDKRILNYLQKKIEENKLLRDKKIYYLVSILNLVLIIGIFIISIKVIVMALKKR